LLLGTESSIAAPARSKRLEQKKPAIPLREIAGFMPKSNIYGLASRPNIISFKIRRRR